jgi:enamine deaminase RidA (YjgF/YER057c/UK114 family)
VQARLAFQHLKAVLEKAGAKPHHITHLQLFFVDTGQGTSFMEKVKVVFKGCRITTTSKEDKYCKSTIN